MTTDRMLTRFVKLDLHSRLLLIARALSTAGYGETRILGRRHFNQKSYLKGAEILCEGMVAGKPHRILVKYVNDKHLHQRNFDELFGVMARENVDLGFIVSHVESHEDFLRFPIYARKLRLFTGKRLMAFFADNGIALSDSDLRDVVRGAWLADSFLNQASA